MSPTPRSAPCFLLIEDDDDHAVLIERTLAQQDAPPEVHRVADGEAALRLLMGDSPESPDEATAEQTADTSAEAAAPASCWTADTRDGDRTLRPDVILLDLNIPKFSGHEVLAQVKSAARLRSIPVVVLTSSNAAVDRERAYAQHANSFLVKPVDFTGFRTLIADLYHYWIRRNERPPARPA